MLDCYADPKNVQVFADGGSGDMGDLDWPEEGVDRCRFAIPDKAFVLSFCRIHFSGSGSGTADLAINIDNSRGRHYDMLLHTVKAVGKGADVNFRVPLDEIKDWILQPGDLIVLTWTNPDSGNILWGVEVGLVDA